MRCAGASWWSTAVGIMYTTTSLLLSAHVLLHLAGPAQSQNLTKCCNWSTLDPGGSNRPCEGDGEHSGACPVGIGCECIVGWTPQAWSAEIARGDRSEAGAHDEPGATISNGYVGAFVPRGVPGSAGPPYVGIEHVKGVFAAGGLLSHTYDSGSGPNRLVSLAPLASWTATAFVAELGGAPAVSTASALDWRRGAYEVVTPLHVGGKDAGSSASSTSERSHCVQRTYTHRQHQHLLVTEFSCVHVAVSGPLSVTIKQRGWCPEENMPPNLDNYSIYNSFCPKVNKSLFTGHGSHMGYARTAVRSGLDGVSCSYATMGAGETPNTATPSVGECHTTVPKAGLKFSVQPGETKLFSLLSARYSNMDAGITTSGPIFAGKQTTGDSSPVDAARAAWIAANASAAELFASHTTAMAKLNT
eukprot:COSAG06_NODE_11508_length_1500_cov_1.803712_1_plen_415_part_01